MTRMISTTVLGVQMAISSKNVHSNILSNTYSARIVFHFCKHTSISETIPSQASSLENKRNTYRVGKRNFCHYDAWRVESYNNCSFLEHIEIMVSSVSKDISSELHNFESYQAGGRPLRNEVIDEVFTISAGK